MQDFVKFYIETLEIYLSFSGALRNGSILSLGWQ